MNGRSLSWTFGLVGGALVAAFPAAGIALLSGAAALVVVRRFGLGS